MQPNLSGPTRPPSASNPSTKHCLPNTPPGLPLFPDLWVPVHSSCHEPPVVRRDSDTCAERGVLQPPCLDLFVIYIAAMDGHVVRRRKQALSAVNFLLDHDSSVHVSSSPANIGIFRPPIGPTATAYSPFHPARHSPQCSLFSAIRFSQASRHRSLPINRHLKRVQNFFHRWLL